MKKNIYLIGFMGTGKSTIAGRLSELCEAQVLEMDEELEKEAGKPIKEIFAQDGEEYFRDMETAWVLECAQKQNCVISCGGGCVLREENAKAMKKSGVLVLLTALPQTVYERVKTGGDRPILNGNMNVEYIADLMEKRRLRYEEVADVVVATDAKTVEEICQEILGELA